MMTRGVDGFVALDDVAVLAATTQALQCRIGERIVWLPRMHVIGSPLVGPNRDLLVRRWIARDRQLLGDGAVAAPTRRLPSVVQLRLVTRQHGAADAI